MPTKTRKEPIKLIVFDLDGTLVNAYPAITRSFNHVMREFGYPAQSALVIRKAVGFGDKNLLAGFVKKRDLEQVLAAYRRYHRKDLLTHARVFGGTLGLLAELKNRGYLLAIATNRPTAFTRIIIRHLKLKAYLDYVLCADTLQNLKPHPEILQKIMRRLRAAPSQTLFVGDMRIDAQTARNAGVAAVMVTTGSHTRQELLKEKPWRIIKGVAALKRLL